jgi:hypothetical protein
MGWKKVGEKGVGGREMRGRGGVCEGEAERTGGGRKVAREVTGM